MKEEEFKKKLDEISYSYFLKDSLTRRYINEQKLMTIFAQLLVELGLSEWSNFKPGAYFVVAVGGKGSEMRTESAVDYTSATRAELEAYIRELRETAAEASDYLLESMVN